MEIKYKRPKRLIYLAMLLILFLFVGSIYLVLYLSDDGGGISEVTVTNITSNAASISWVTDKYSKGSVIYGTNNNYGGLFTVKNGKTERFDDRDTKQDNEGRYILKDSGGRERKTHHVTLHGLDPNTTYYFKVGDGRRFFDGDITSVRTGGIVDDLKAPDPVYGIVENFEGNAPEPTEGIVYYYVYETNNESNKSKLYSSILNESQSNWTGNLSALIAINGGSFHWEKDNYRINVYVKTDRGYGVGDYRLNKYKPLPNLVVNVKYNINY